MLETCHRRVLGSLTHIVRDELQDDSCRNRPHAHHYGIGPQRPFSLIRVLQDLIPKSLDICIYIYIHTYIHTYIYIYMYNIHIWTILGFSIPQPEPYNLNQGIGSQKGNIRA